MDKESIFKPWTFQELIDYSNSPEGKKEARQLEQEYRRGYWDGAFQALEFLREGTPARQLNHWLYKKLWKWRYANHDDIVIPPKIPAWPKLRKLVLESYGEICAYCGEKATHVDHITPVAQGGGDEVNNLVAACQGCNFHKQARTPEEAGMEIKFYPLRELEVIEVGYYRELEIRFKT